MYTKYNPSKFKFIRNDLSSKNHKSSYIYLNTQNNNNIKNKLSGITVISKQEQSKIEEKNKTDDGLQISYKYDMLIKIRLLTIKVNPYEYAKTCIQTYFYLPSNSISKNEIVLPRNNYYNFYIKLESLNIRYINCFLGNDDIYTILLDLENCIFPYDLIIGNENGEINNKKTNLNEQLKCGYPNIKYIYIFIIVENGVSNYKIYPF
jgi:hypothetical protein